MKCPKYISEALRVRANCAAQFLHNDVMIGKWLEEHNLIDKVEMYDIYGGCESYANPYESSRRILEVIENA